MILSNRELIRYINEGRVKINPLKKSAITGNGIDLSLGAELYRLKTCRGQLDTRKQSGVSAFYEKEVGEEFTVHSHEHVLLCTLEELTLSTNIVAFIGLRSTYSRLGLSMPFGVIESGFKGQLTLEVIGGPFPLKIYSGDRLFHVIFTVTTSSSKVYKGKYQNQKGATLPVLLD